MKQAGKIGDIANLAAQRIWADLLLEDGPHPFECGQPGLDGRIRMGAGPVALDRAQAPGIAVF